MASVALFGRHESSYCFSQRRVGFVEKKKRKIVSEQLGRRIFYADVAGRGAGRVFMAALLQPSTCQFNGA